MEMDDLLDQLEMEVERERVIKRKEEQISKECVKTKNEMGQNGSELISSNALNDVCTENTDDNLFITTSSIPVKLDPENAHLVGKDADLPKTNGKIADSKLNSKSVVEKIEVRGVAESPTIEIGIQDESKEEPDKVEDDKNTEVSIEASFEREEPINPASKIVKEDERLFDSANIQQPAPEAVDSSIPDEQQSTESVISNVALDLNETPKHNDNQQSTSLLPSNSKKPEKVDRNVELLSDSATNEIKGGVQQPENSTNEVEKEVQQPKNSTNEVEEISNHTDPDLPNPQQIAFPANEVKEPDVKNNSPKPQQTDLPTNEIEELDVKNNSPKSQQTDFPTNEVVETNVDVKDELLKSQQIGLPTNEVKEPDVKNDSPKTQQIDAQNIEIEEDSAIDSELPKFQQIDLPTNEVVETNIDVKNELPKLQQDSSTSEIEEGSAIDSELPKYQQTDPSTAKIEEINIAIKNELPKLQQDSSTGEIEETNVKIDSSKSQQIDAQSTGESSAIDSELPKSQQDSSTSEIEETNINVSDELPKSQQTDAQNIEVKENQQIDESLNEIQEKTPISDNMPNKETQLDPSLKEVEESSANLPNSPQPLNESADISSSTSNTTFDDELDKFVFNDISTSSATQSANPIVEEHEISLSKKEESNDETTTTRPTSNTDSVQITISAPESEQNGKSPAEIKKVSTLSNAAYEMAQNLLEEIGDVKKIVELAKELKAVKVEESKKDEKVTEEMPGPSSVESPVQDDSEIPTQDVPTTPEPKEQKRSVIMSTHAVGINVGNDLRLTESELQLGKAKPIWIKDEHCKQCMLCSAKFTLVNRRHHCRSCGRVLCSDCCSIRRSLPYMQQDEKKQRVCSPCNSTLDRIELYEKAAENTASDTPTSSSSADPNSSTSSSFFVRKKSVLKTRTKSENDTPNESTEQPTTSTARRNVKFLDGISPGDEQLPTSPKREAETQRSQGIFSSRPSRSSRSSSRRSRDAMAREENQRLDARWFYCCHDLVAGGLTPWKPAELFKRLEDNLPVRLILKRNIHVILQFTEYLEKKAYVLYTVGFNTLGVDELLIVFEKRPNEKDAYLPASLIRSLMRYSELCLSPTTNLLDDKNGIRQCANRMSTLFELEADETEGHDAVAIYFHPYQNQDLSSISHPNNGAFRIGLFVQESELALVKAMPSRFLHRLGMMTSVYPIPILNEIGRPPVFEPFKSTQELSSSTILTMFHDFRNNSYQLPKIPGSYSLIRESGTQICLPVWAQDQMKSMAETNTNLLAWALELSYQADSLFTCERTGQTFSTRIFMKSNTRETIGAAFVAFSTGHKGPENGFTQTVVEDGVVIRLSSDGLENLLKKLASGDDFRLQNESTSLEIKWLENEELTSYGSICSPIDGTDLRGFYQYGLLLNRVIHANQIFYSDKSKALRLGSVISLNQHKIDPQTQSHFFDACEQLTLWLKTSLESYVNMLLGLEITQICVRIYASTDRVGYDLGPWTGLEDAYEEFLKVLAEKVIPFLYNLLETSQLDFRAELHLPIISIEPLFSMNAEIPIRNSPFFSDSELVSEESTTSSS